MKHFAFTMLYIAVGLVIAGLLAGVVAKVLPASLGGGTAAPAA